MCEILQTQEIVSETEGGKGAEEDQPKSPRTSDLLFPHRVKTGIEFIKLSLIPSHPCLPASPLRFGMKVRRREKKEGGGGQKGEAKEAEGKQQWEVIFSKLSLSQRSRSRGMRCRDGLKGKGGMWVVLDFC